MPSPATTGAGTCCRCFARIQRLAGRDIQRIGLSATVGNPEEMLDWLSSGSTRQQAGHPARTDRPEAEPEVQLDYVGSLANAAKVIRLLHQGEKRLVFCDSRSRVEQLALLLRQDGVDTFVSHSSLGLDERRSAEQAFAQRQNCVIVATSSLELGLDVGDLDRVIQIDAPPTVSSFLQRMGRTGRRAGTTSNCLFLATTDEGLLRAAALLDLWQDGFVEPVSRPAEAVPHPGPAVDGAGPAREGSRPKRVVRLGGDRSRLSPRWTRQGRVGPRGLHAAFRHLCGPTTACCPSPPRARRSTAARTSWSFCRSSPRRRSSESSAGRKELGFVHESTFYKRDDGPPILVLAGRSWKTNHLDWKRRIAHVEPTEERGRSRWLGEGQFLSYRVCQSIRRLLAADANQPIWSQRATAQIDEIRTEYPWASADATSIVRHPNGEVRWWTFGGGIANALLADHLRPQGRSAGGQPVDPVHDHGETERGRRVDRGSLG